MKRIGIVILFVWFSACTDKNDFLLQEYNKSFADIIGRSLTLNGLSKELIGMDSKYKTLVLLNTQCATCLVTLKRWVNSMENEIFNDKTIIFLSYGEYNEYFDINFSEITAQVGNINYHQDLSNQFIYENKLELYSLEVFLLDRENKVLLIGDPTKDSLIESFYRKL